MKQMKKLFFVTIFLIVMLLAPMAMADQITAYQSAYSYGSGGEFTMKIVGSGSPDLDWVLPYYVENKTKNIGDHDPSFQTFCVETSEYFTPGNTYNFTITDHSIFSNVKLTKGAAWLYHEFQIGELEDYEYTDAAGRKDDAGKLQATIWWLMGVGSEPGSGNEFRNAVLTEFGSEAAAKAANAGTYPVAVLNLWIPGGFDESHKAQDMLVCVPEPATMLFLGGGLLGMAGFLRKKFKK